MLASWAGEDKAKISATAWHSSGSNRGWGSGEGFWGRAPLDRPTPMGSSPHKARLGNGWLVPPKWRLGNECLVVPKAGLGNGWLVPPTHPPRHRNLIRPPTPLAFHVSSSSAHNNYNDNDDFNRVTSTSRVEYKALHFPTSLRIDGVCRHNKISTGWQSKDLWAPSVNLWHVKHLALYVRHLCRDPAR